MAEPTERITPAVPSAAFEALRERFVTGLQQRWNDIADDADPALRRQALHRLAGVAGSYGFDAVGAAAREAEEAVGRGDPVVLDRALARLRERLAEQGVTVR